MLSEITLKENYLEDNGEEYWEYTGYRYWAKPVRYCDTAPLIREFRELKEMWENDIGDEDELEHRMMQIKKELKNRGVEV